MPRAPQQRTGLHDNIIWSHTTLNFLQSPLRLSRSHFPSSGPTHHFPPNCSSFLWCLPSLDSSITAHSAWAFYSHPISLLVGDSLCIPKYQSHEATVNIDSRLPALRHLGSVIPSLPNLATCSLSLAWISHYSVLGLSTYIRCLRHSRFPE